MKKLFLFLTLFAWAMMAITMVTGSAMALSLSDVTIDDLIAQSKLMPSNEAAEIDWLNDVLEDGYVFTYSKDEDLDGEWTVLDDDSSVFVHNLVSDPTHYVIKTGNVTPGDEYRNFLFENLVALNRAVIDLDEMGFSNIENIRGVSHISEFDGAPVPEPATILLLGSGLVGLAGFGRKKFKK